MAVTELTKWRICGKCGRKFLGLNRNSETVQIEYCPACRVETVRKFLRDTLAKWQRYNNISEK